MGKQPTFDRRVQQIGERGGDNDALRSVLMVLHNLQNQISSIGRRIAIAQSTAAADGVDSTGADFNKSAGTDLLLTNKSGAGRNYGEVVVYDINNTKAFTTTTTTNDDGVAGVVVSDSPDGTVDAILDDADGMVRAHGRCRCYVNANVTAIAIGDNLIAHSVAGFARKARSPHDPGMFAIALESKASGTGLISVSVITSHGFKNAVAGQNFDFRIGYDTDGTVTGFSGMVLSTKHWHSAMMSIIMDHTTFRYSGEFIMSITLSQFTVNGTGTSTANQAMSYTGGQITKIIQEVSG